MKKFIYFFIFFFVSIQYDVVAQKNDGTDYILNSQEFKTSFLEKSYYKDVKLPFNEIIIFDKRFDTSKLGYLKIPNIGKKAFGKIQLQRTWTAIINHYFRKNLNPSSTSKLIIYIRSFWMQEGALDEMTTKKVITKSILGKADAYGNSKADIDIYVQTDTTLQALFKIEDVFLNYYKFTANKMDEWFFLPFDSLARKMATTDVTLTLNKKRKLSFKEVNDFYSRRTNIPVLENTETQKGIYLTFEDFKNNRLWLTDFKFTNGKVTDELYLINNGKQTLFTDFWGFNDGKNLLIKLGFNIFSAVRQQNTFEIFGAKHISNYHNNPGHQAQINLSSVSLDLKILQLNMETGTFF